MNRPNERKLPSFPLEKVRLLVVQYLICSFLILISGIIAFVFVAVSLKETKTEKFLYIIEDLNDNFIYLMKGSCLCTIIVGTICILTHLLGYPGRLLCSLAYLLIVSFSVAMVGIGEAASINISNEQSYKRMMQMDSYYFKHRDLLKMYNDKTLVSEFQEILHCCGMFSNKDWISTPCNCIPLSCSKTKEYREKFSDGSSLKKLGHNFSEIESYIWGSGCLSQIQNIISNLKRKFLIVFGVLSVIHLILTVWYYHISSIMKELVLCRAGHLQLQIFKAHWPSKNIQVKKQYRRLARVKDILSSSDTDTSLDGLEDKENVLPTIENENKTTDINETAVKIVPSSQNTQDVRETDIKDDQLKENVIV